MPETADCPHCEAPMRFDLRGSCRSCGTKIASIAKPGIELAIPRTWGELWPTLVLSLGLLGIGAAFLLAGVFILKNFYVGRGTLGFGSIIVGGAFVLSAAKCWLK